MAGIFDPMKPTEKAYLAGIIDGEGCITITKRKQGQNWYYRPIVAIVNTDKQMITYVKNLTNG